MTGYPAAIASVDHIEPVPRRIRALFDGEFVVDTYNAKYLWEFPPYPQYYVPLADVADGVLADTGEVEDLDRGKARVHTAGHGQARVYDDGLVAGLVRFDWDAMDSWFEEEEEVFVHPRNPYSRCDAIRSSRQVQVERDGKVLAESSSTVIVFETGSAAALLLPPQAGRVLRAPDAERHPDGLPVQGPHDRVLVGRQASGPGLVLRLPDRRAATDRRPDRLLQRTGRPHHRRRSPGTLDRQTPFSASQMAEVSPPSIVMMAPVT